MHPHPPGVILKPQRRQHRPYRRLESNTVYTSIDSSRRGYDKTRRSHIFVQPQMVHLFLG